MLTHFQSIIFHLLWSHFNIRLRFFIPIIGKHFFVENTSKSVSNSQKKKHSKNYIMIFQIKFYSCIRNVPSFIYCLILHTLFSFLPSEWYNHQ